MARNSGPNPRLVRCPQTRLHAIEHALGRGATKARQPSLLQRIFVRDCSRRHIVRNVRPRGVAQGQRQGLLALVVGIVENRYRNRLLRLARGEGERPVRGCVVLARLRGAVRGRVVHRHRPGGRSAQCHREFERGVRLLRRPRVRNRQRRRSDTGTPLDLYPENQASVPFPIGIARAPKAEMIVDIPSFFGPGVVFTAVGRAELGDVVICATCRAIKQEVVLRVRLQVGVLRCPPLIVRIVVQLASNEVSDSGEAGFAGSIVEVDACIYQHVPALMRIMHMQQNARQFISPEIRTGSECLIQSVLKLIQQYDPF